VLGVGYLFPSTSLSPWQTNQAFSDSLEPRMHRYTSFTVTQSASHCRLVLRPPSSPLPRSRFPQRLLVVGDFDYSLGGFDYSLGGFNHSIGIINGRRACRTGDRRVPTILALALSRGLHVQSRLGESLGEEIVRASGAVREHVGQALHDVEHLQRVLGVVRLFQPRQHLRSRR